MKAAKHAAARAVMHEMRGDSGSIFWGSVLGIMPPVIVVPSTLEDATLHVLNIKTADSGGPNP